MARPFSSAQERELIERHHQLLERLAQAAETPGEYRERVKKASDALISKTVTDVLREIPVEEINRDKRGYRVKSLRDAGFETIADLAQASVRRITMVNGISSEGAREIKKLVTQMSAQVRKGARIRLSLDNKSREASELVGAVSKYSRLRQEAGECRRLLEENQQQIAYAIADITAVSGLKRIFASRAKKKRAAQGYEVLKLLDEGNFRREAEERLRRIDKIKSLGRAQAWSDFAQNPVPFYKVLEEVAPGAMGGDSVYGLPEDLAGQVGVVEFSTQGLKCQLRRYQEWGVRYILHQGRVLLGDEMGLGKTVQAIAAMVSLRNGGGTHFAVVCPASVVTNWCRELERMSDLTVYKIHGPDRDQALEGWLQNGGAAVTTYETTSFFELPKELRLSLLVVDEAHYIKNPEARRTVNVKRMSAGAERLLFMTGTALENNVDEMIELIGVLRPDMVPSIKKIASISAAPRFREAVAPVYYRRRREDVLTELPELIESREWCALNDAEEAAYEDALMSGSYSDVRRVSWNVDDLSNSSKAGRLLELVEEAQSEGRKVIVFSFFLDTIRRVTELLGERCTDPINGSVPPQRRQEIIDEFDAAPAGTVLPAQIQSGGTGLNIQSASVVILCEPQFKPSTENQAISRAYRMGQTRNVLVYRLLCEDTVDEKILSLLESKQAVFDAFADKSVAAASEPELDDKSFGMMVREERERVAALRAGEDSGASKMSKALEIASKQERDQEGSGVI